MNSSSKNNDRYIPRIIDVKVSQYLNYFSALNIVGPKWCGKTRTALSHARRSFFLSQRDTRMLLSNDFTFLRLKSSDECPILIDEWQIIPEIWDEVRINCDLDSSKGLYILTGSTSLKTLLQHQKIHHTGIGRIPNIKMDTMTLSETGDSLNRINLQNLYDNTVRSEILNTPSSLNQIANWIIRGGWPENINMPDPSILPKAYIESLKNETYAEYQNLAFEPARLIRLLYSLARNESTIVSDRTLLKDISSSAEAQHGSTISSSQTLNRYKEIIAQLYLSDNTLHFVRTIVLLLDFPTHRKCGCVMYH